MMTISPSVLTQEHLQILAHNVLDTLKKKRKNHGTVIFLEGDLGAGKTSFTQALARELGVMEKVVSPTFILKKTYVTSDEVFTSLVHVDAYRLNDPKESKALRLDEDVSKKNTLIVVEWPNNMMYLESDALITFKVVDDTHREITVQYEKR